MRVAFVPELGEHFRATSALARVARVFDGHVLLPRFLAAVVLMRLAISAINGADAVDTFFSVSPLLMFLVGVGIRARRGLGGTLAYELADDALRVERRGRAYEVPWARMRWVDETPEFFLVAADHLALYLPKRALAGPDEEAAVRRALAREAAAG